MSDYKTYSITLFLNNVFIGMNREEMEKTILKMWLRKGFNAFKVEVDELYLLKPTVKNTVKVRIFYKEKIRSWLLWQL